MESLKYSFKYLISLILMAIFIISCNSIDNLSYQGEEYSGINTSADSIIEYVYTLYYSIPSSYKEKTYFMEEYYTTEYIYEDSLKFYIDKGASCPSTNYDNILANKDFYNILTIGYNHYSTYDNVDSLILEGRNENGLFWKNIRMRGIHIGYTNVPLEKLEIFENAIRSAKKVYNSTRRYKNFTQKYKNE